MLRNLFASLLAVTLLSTAGAARASEPTDASEPGPTEIPRATPTRDRHDDLLLTAGLGIFGEARKAGGALSVTGLRQQGLLGYGATFEYSSAIFDYTSITAAPMVGIFIDAPTWARVGLAGTGGIHHYEGVGRGLLSSDHGASGTTAFVGARAFIGAEAGGKARFHIGLQLSIDDDLTRTRGAYTYQETSWTAPHPATAEHTVGALRFGGMLALGTAFDL